MNSMSASGRIAPAPASGLPVWSRLLSKIAMSPDAVQVPTGVAERGILPAAVLLPALLSLGGCGIAGAPSYDLFGAFFPAWLLCGTVGIAGAVAARVVFVSTGVANTLPYQLAVCTAVGVITALVVWLVGFGR
jgi:4-amino-4-deoxy-L-arabinose transferase-like glycosyltransferase